MNRWIDFNKRIPKEQQKVLLYYPNSEDIKIRNFNVTKKDEATHWFPVPAIPRKETKETKEIKLTGDEITLAQFIEDVDDESIIRIGARSSFIFIGTKYRFYKDLQLINDTLYNDVWKTLKRNLDDEDILIRRIQRLREISFKVTGDQKKERDEALEYIKRSIGAEVTRINLIEEKEKHLRDFVKIENRLVLDSYDSVYGDGCIVKIQGDEDGKYWFQEEYDSKVINGGCSE